MATTSPPTHGYLVEGALAGSDGDGWRRVEGLAHREVLEERTIGRCCGVAVRLLIQCTVHNIKTVVRDRESLYEPSAWPAAAACRTAGGCVTGRAEVPAPSAART